MGGFPPMPAGRPRQCLGCVDFIIGEPGAVYCSSCSTVRVAEEAEAARLKPRTTRRALASSVSGRAIALGTFGR